jgi:pyruvyltransferase
MKITQEGEEGNIFFSFNPRRSVLPSPIRRFFPLRRQLNNFGDLLGPLLARKILEEKGYATEPLRGPPPKILSVGSVLHFARDGDIVWGSGRNGKVSDSHHNFRRLDVRAVRGPLTRKYLEERGISCREIYGDPALLVPYFFPEMKGIKKKREIIFVPNYNDMWEIKTKFPMISPCRPLMSVIQFICESEFVTSTSLHAVVIAESFGIEARFVRSGAEHPFKYEDYLRGTGRTNYEPGETPEESVMKGGQGKLKFDQDALINAFPFDLFSKISP